MFWSQEGRGANRADDANQIALGLLVVAAILPIAASQASAPVMGVRGLGSFAGLGELLILPAFLFVAGFESAGRISWSDALRRVVVWTLAVVVAGLVGTVSGRQPAIAAVLQIVALPLLYTLPMRPLGRPLPIFAVAIVLHVFGVVAGGTAGLLLTPFIYFAAGALLGDRRDRIARFCASERELAVTLGPVVIAAAVVFVARTTPLAPVPGVADIGPPAVALGLAAGLATIAAAQALATSRFGGHVARIGQAAPFIAIGWLPLFHLSLKVADNGLPPGAPSLLLFAIASLGVVYALADMAMREPEPAQARVQGADPAPTP